jgi:hypothetical protein
MRVLDIVNQRLVMLSIYIERKLQHTFVHAHYIFSYITSKPSELHAESLYHLSVHALHAPRPKEYPKEKTDKSTFTFLFTPAPRLPPPWR